MNIDDRCCGTGTCIINADGECWCGQKWDGEKMCFPSLDSTDLTAGRQHIAPDSGAKPEPVSR